MLADFPVCDWRRYCIAPCDVKFRQLEGNGWKFRHLASSSVKFSNSVFTADFSSTGIPIHTVLSPVLIACSLVYRPLVQKGNWYALATNVLLRHFKRQIYRAGNSLNCSSLISHKSNERLWAIRSDRSRQMRELLRSLISKELPWANHSGLSYQKSYRERFAQVAHDKWANERFTQKTLATILFYSMLYKRFFI